MLAEIVRGRLLEARGVVGFYPANSVGDDIVIFEDEGDAGVRRARPVATLYGLRQQVGNKRNKDPNGLFVDSFMSSDPI